MDSGADATAGPPLFSDLTISLEPASSSVLARIAESVGHIPHVLLRDTETETGPGPIVKPSSPEMPAPAARPDRYQIFGEIARGGMGAVLRGRDVDLGRDLAVKVLLDSHKDKPELVRRFVEEAQVGGQLQHPGIVPVYELGAFADRRPFFTMKLVKGRTLAELLRARPSPAVDLSRFLSIFESIAQTMAYAHVRGVIHRDLKPSNVMVGSFGEVQVMDWGLSKVLPRGGATDDEPEPRPESEVVSVIRTGRSGSADDASQAGSVLGTPGYMAPEQARGEIEAVDERADVFGLGAILCEILTGEPAFVARTSGEAMRKAGRAELGEAFARLGACGAEPDLIAMARDCLAGERDDRPRRAGDVSERITAYLGGVQERLRKAELARVAAETLAGEERKRRRLTIALAACILALVTLGGGVAAWQMQQRQAQLAAVETTLARIQTLRDRAAADGADASRWRETLAAADQALASIGKLATSRPGIRFLALRNRIADEQTQAELDERLVNDLTNIRTSVPIIPGQSDLDASVMDRRLRLAFKRHKMDLDTMPIGDAIARLRSRPDAFVREVTGVLDYWLIFRRDLLKREPDRKQRSLRFQRLLDLLARLDPDPERNRLRELLKQSDLKPHRNPLQAIARTGKVVDFGPSTSLLLSRALQEAGDYPGAIDILRVAIVRYPGDVWTNVELGRLFTAASPPQADEAIRYFTAVRAVRPQSGGYLIGLLERQGREDEAEAILRDLVRLNPIIGSTQFELIGLLVRRGKVKEARSFAERLTSGHNKQLGQELGNVGVRSNLGNMLFATGDTEGAKDAWRMASRLDPKNADCRYMLGRLLAFEGDLHGAVESLRETIAIDPLRVDCFYDLADALHRLSQHNEEIATLREAIRAQAAARNKGSAAGDGNKAVANLPVPTPSPPAALDADEDASLDDDSREADVDNGYLQAVTVGPFLMSPADNRDVEQGHMALGNALAESGDLAGAIASFTESIRLGEGDSVFRSEFQAASPPRSSPTRLGEGDSVFRSESRTRTTQFAAWRSAPHTYLGNAYRLAGDYSRAIAAFREAVRLGPEHAREARYNLGVACAEAGDLQAAVAAIGEAIRRDYHSWLAPLRLLRAITMAQAPANAVEALRRIRGHADGQEAIVQAIDHAIAQYDRIMSLSVQIPRIFHRSNRGDNLAELCYNERYFSASSAVWLSGFTTDPKLAEDMEAQNRYNAACSAALATAGAGIDKPPLDDHGRSLWRRQAIEWLKADLVYWTARIKTGSPETKAEVVNTLRHWKSDPDLAGLRDEEPLKTLRDDELKECRALWSEVDQLLNGGAMK